MIISRKQWLVAIVMALLVHVGLAAWFKGVFKYEGIAQPGDAGVEINIGLLDIQPEPESTPEPEAEPEPEVIPEPVVEPEPIVEPTPVIEQVVQPQPVVEQMAEVEEVETIVLPDTPVSTTVPMRTVSTEPAEFIAAFTPPADTPPVSAPSSQPKPAASSSAGDAAPKQNYYLQLAGWIAKHKEYPFRAKVRRMTGTAKVRFTINRRGELKSAELVESSGHSLLDEGTMAMLKKASPFPPIADDIEGETLTVTLPVEYTLTK